MFGENSQKESFFREKREKFLQIKKYGKILLLLYKYLDKKRPKNALKIIRVFEKMQKKSD